MSYYPAQQEEASAPYPYPPQQYNAPTYMPQQYAPVPPQYAPVPAPAVVMQPQIVGYIQAPPPQVIQVITPDASANEPTQADRSLAAAKDISKTCCEGCNQFFSNIWGNCCAFTRLRPYVVAQSVFFSLMIATIICLIIWVSIKETIVKNDDKAEENLALRTVKTTCQFISSPVNNYRCCDKQNCQCSECGSAMTCAAAMSGLVATSCCNGYQCCEYNQCSRTVYDDCPPCTTKYTPCKCTVKNGVVTSDCTKVCSGTSCNSQCSDGQTCSKCPRQEFYACTSNGCKRPVSNSVCTNVCGNCANIVTTYSYLVGDRTQTYTLSQSCGRDDTTCVSNWQGQHPLNTPIDCWYDSDRPNDGVSFSVPTYNKDKHAYRAYLAFLIMMCIFGFVALLFCRCRCAKN